ncbi:MAG: tetratricopeptide repeat protein [Limisphaerales bacterium]
MKRLIALAGLLLVALLPEARAQNADDQYIIIYSLMQQADGLENSGEPRQALAQYVETQAELERFQKIFPDWHPNIVSFRLNYLADKIAAISAKVPATNSVVKTQTVTNATAAISANADLQSELSALHDQMRQLQTDNTTLQAKLKEALTEQPTAINSSELTKAQARIESLTKENTLLKEGITQAQASATMTSGAAALEQLRRQLADANRKLAQQTERANKLAAENQKLQTKIQSLLASASGMEALREENQLLKKQLADLRSAPTETASTADLNSELARLREQLATLQANAEVNWLEKSALENRLQRFQSVSPVPPATKELTGELKTLRARLAVDEARPVPFTPEELALFRQSAPQLVASPETNAESTGESPADTVTLVAEAQRDFSSQQFDKAEDAYLKILRHNENDPQTLANLARVEIDLHKFKDAEKHIRQALAQNPDDAYSLSILGRLESLQGKYDAALDALSRAAKLDPQSPQIENFLGMAFAQKGLRKQAETALRKAVQLDPNYGDAHNNLAVIYISQQPPMPELARWHYQKALEDGEPRNPELEKMLAEKGAPVNSQ